MVRNFSRSNCSTFGRRRLTSLLTTMSIYSSLTGWPLGWRSNKCCCAWLKESRSCCSACISLSTVSVRMGISKLCMPSSVRLWGRLSRSNVVGFALGNNWFAESRGRRENRRDRVCRLRGVFFRLM